uniref:NAD-dependent epimerase/dehydratase domain-containing protein n=1 Tax=Oryza punctata TaxID=4537 RepID=A0A0E0M8S5_ORYPU
MRGGKTVCVTGGSGYIASGLIKFLLEKGYAVNTTVRNPGPISLLPSISKYNINYKEKTFHFKDLHALGPLNIFRANLNEEGSFDEAITGCLFVFLVAAPVIVDSENLQEDITETNVRGTLNVMRSCARARATVKRVILTSSVNAVLYDGRTMQGDGHVSGGRVVMVRPRLPRNSAQLPSCKLVLHCEVIACMRCWMQAKAYGAGKVRSEKEVSRLARENAISLATVLPAVVVGAAPATKRFNSSALVLSLLAGR